jgi:TPR repeat protein
MLQQVEELEKALFLQKQENLLQDFMGKIKTLIDKNKLEARSCFFSYAWEDESTPFGKEANAKLQNCLERLARDLKKVNVAVFLDVESMQGDMKKCMKENIKKSDYIVLIGTPRYKERAGQDTNVAFEFKRIQRKVRAEKKNGNTNILLPLLYSGDFGTSFPKKVTENLIRDIRESTHYCHVLIGNKKPLGLIPHMYPEFHEGGAYHLEYSALLQIFTLQTEVQPIKLETISSSNVVSGKEGKKTDISSVQGLTVPVGAVNANSSITHSKLDTTISHVNSPLEILMKQAASGDAAAQNNLGEHYYYGKGGVSKSYEQAFGWFMKAACQNYPVAQFNVGNCFYNGQSVGQNFTTAVEWYTKAAHQGEVNAQNMLGNCYKKGKGPEVPKNLELAFKWFMESAKRNHVPAQFNVGACYQNGEGTPQNYGEATQWYEKAAKQDHTEAQYFLGICYEKGWGVPQDYQIARELHEKAAAKGHAGSKKRLEEKLPKVQNVYNPTNPDYKPSPNNIDYQSVSRHLFFSGNNADMSTPQLTEARSNKPLFQTSSAENTYRPDSDAIHYDPSPQKPSSP